MNRMLRHRAQRWVRTRIQQATTVRNWTHEDAARHLEAAWMAGARSLDKWYREFNVSEAGRLRQANADMRKAMLDGLPELERLRKIDVAAKLVVTAWWRDGIGTNDPDANDAMQALVEFAAPKVTKA
jgi:hypothetical protein